MTALTRRRLLQAGGLVAASLAVPTIPAALAATTPVGIAGDPLGRGYWILNADGTVVARGTARKVPVSGGLGSAATGLAAFPTGGGLWRVSRGGRVVGAGRATVTAASAPNRDSRVVGVAPNARGDGLWRVTAQGQVIASGDARHLGAAKTDAAIVGVAGHPEAAGYWILDRQGVTHGRGAARVLGPSAGAAAVGIAAHPSGDGYWVARSDGRVVAYGVAEHHGNSGFDQPVIDIATAADGGGYWLLHRDGTVRGYGSARSGLADNGVTEEPELASVGGIIVAASIRRRLRGLLAHAEDDGIRLGGWGYRSTSRQVELRRQNCGPRYYDVFVKSSSECSPMTARPGSSMHEQGLAIDFYVRRRDGGTGEMAGTRAFRWMKRNAKTYGLYNLPSEPWHWSTNGH